MMSDSTLLDTHIISVEIELDGSKKINHISHLTIVQRHDWHHTFELELPMENVEGRDSQGKPKSGFSESKKYIGKTIKVSFASLNSSEPLNQFNGIITDLSVSRHSGTGGDIIFKGYSNSILMDDGENTRSFLKSTLKDIVSKIGQEYSSGTFSFQADVSPNPTLEYKVQYRETNFSFVNRLASEMGKWFYYDGKNMNFGKLVKGDKANMMLGNDLSSFDLGMHVKPMKYNDVTYDYVNNSQIKVASSSISVTGLDDLGKKIHDDSNKLFRAEVQALPSGKYKNQGELKEITTAKKSAVAANLVTMTGSSYNPRLKIGTQIAVSDMDGTSFGSYIVLSVSHYTDNLGVYQNTFSAVSSSITVPPPNPHVVYPNSEAMPAKVTDNKDEESHGRIKVKFHWQESEGSSWIRQTTPHAGKNRGFYFLPEIDEEVMVGFEGNNPERPYIIGSLYHGKAKHEDRKDDKNEIKTIRTKSGNEIQFIDKDGEEQVIVRNKDSQNEISISLKDDGLITIKGKNKIHMSAKEILIEAEKKLEMKSDETHLSGKSKLTMDGEQKVEIKGNEMNVETQTKLSMKAGTEAELKGSVGVTIDGGPKTSVKSSAQLELNGGAIATLKGGMVMIN